MRCLFPCRRDNFVGENCRSFLRVISYNAYELWVSRVQLASHNLIAKQLIIANDVISDINILRILPI